MAQALGIFTSASGHVASTLGLVNFSPECFTGHPLRPSSSESNPSTIWIAAGVDADGGTPGFGLAGGIMPDARVYSQKAKLLGKTIHQNGVWPGDTNHIVVPQTEKQYGHYTLFSGNRETGNGRDNAVCIAWATIHWPAKGSEYAWSGGWGRACEDWGAQWYYSGITIPGSDDYTPDCLWVYNWDPERDAGYPPGTDDSNPPVQGFHVNWADMRIGEDDPRLNTSAQAMCNSRSFRLYKNHDPQTLDLRDGEVGKRPDIIPTSRYTTSEKTTTTEQSPTEPPTTEPTTESTTAPTTEPTTAPTTEPTTEPTTAPTTEPTTEPTTSDPKTESSPTTTTETESSTTTISISLSVTTIPHSSKSTESFITKTLTIEPALKLKIRQGQAKKEEQQQQQQQQQPPQNPGRPAGPRHRRAHSIPEKFANVLVINDHAKQTAEGLCGSKGSLGPSFADARGRMYCDMDTKTLYPFCEGVGQAAGQGDGGDTEPCFDFGGSNMLRGAGVQRRQAPRVQDWRVSRGKGGR